MIRQSRRAGMLKLIRIGFAENLREGRFGLTINRQKTKVAKLKEESASLNFLGYEFRYHRDLHGGEHQYLNLQPSPKSMRRERDKLRVSSLLYW